MVSNKHINIFIVSSREHLDVATAIQTNFASYDVNIWDRIFDAGMNFTESLLSAIDKADFAIVILTPDDTLYSRKKKFSVPRDNVIYEFGMCVGKLGFKRTFYLYEYPPIIKLPTDILGITGIEYICTHDPHKLIEDLRPACLRIENFIKKEGLRHKSIKGAHDFKAHVDMWYYDKGFTRAQAHDLANILGREGVNFKIKSHSSTKFYPDTIFIGPFVPVFYAQLVLNNLPYQVKYIYRFDYPEVEGGDDDGFSIGIGYSSLYNKSDDDITCQPIPISTQELNALKNPHLNNRQFQSLLHSIVMCK